MYSITNDDVIITNSCLSDDVIITQIALVFAQVDEKRVSVNQQSLAEMERELAALQEAEVKIKVR